MRSLLALCLLVLGACRGPAQPEEARVQDSVDSPPNAVVRINGPDLIAPQCAGRIYSVRTDPPRAVAGDPLVTGSVVEFQNLAPDIPANITGIGALPGGAVMFSPNLVRPYNFVESAAGGFSFWRYRFEAPGIYQYFDTNVGDPGRRVVDAYYGTVTFVGESDAPRGVVCVDPPGCEVSTRCLQSPPPEGVNCCTCMGVCCAGPASAGGGHPHCTGAQECREGRCADPATAP